MKSKPDKFIKGVLFVKSKNKWVIFNWFFSIFCLSGFFVYWGHFVCVWFLLLGIASLPISVIRDFFYQLPGGPILRIAILSIAFVIGVAFAPSSNSEVPVQSPSSVPSTTETTQPAPSASPIPSASPSPIPTVSNGFEITFIDVGQADSALVECDGHFMLIDGGNVDDSSKIYSILEKKGVERLDYVIATHAHEDHVGGLSGALERASAGSIFCPVTTYDSDAFQEFKTRADSNGGIIVPTAGTEFSLGSSSVKILGLNAGENVNDSSIILKITYGDNSFLFMADAEYAGEQAIIGQDLSADLLKVGHHGSETSTSYQFLREVMPQYAVISVGEGNSYGHPDDSVLSRLRDADVTLYRTDLQGDIVVTSDGTNLTIVPSKNADIQTNPTADDSTSAITSSPAATPAPTPAPTPEPQQSSQETMVWVSGSGKRYHSIPNCSNMKNPSQIPKSEAEARGRTPCANCW